MQTKPLLYGLIGFLLGGLLAAFGGTIIHKRGSEPATSMTIAQMTESLKNKSGDDFDKAFLSEMISHHQGAIDMAKLAETRAKHDKIKSMAADIISAQTQEISTMQAWQSDWSYTTTPRSHDMNSVSH